MQYEIRRNLSKNGGGRPGLLAFCESLKPQCFDARRFAGVLAFGVAALILYTFPVLVLILSLAASGGLGIMLLPSMGRFNHAGLLLAVGAAALFATTFFIGARGSRNVPARTMAFWVTVVGLGITAPRPRRFTPRRMILQPGKAA